MNEECLRGLHKYCDGCICECHDRDEEDNDEN